MLFTPEMRRTIETSFLPLACQCTLMPGDALMVKIFDPDTGRIAMLADNVSISHLTSVRALAELIAELRYDLRTCATPFGSAPAFSALFGGA